MLAKITRDLIDEIYERECVVPTVAVMLANPDGDVIHCENATDVMEELEELAKGEDWLPNKAMVARILAERARVEIYKALGVRNES